MRLRPVLADADTLLICDRDSEAYALLEPIRVGMFDVDDDTYALYCTLLLQAQDRCDVPLVDSIAVGAYIYYRENKEDCYHAGLAHYYMGKVTYENRDFSSTLYIEKQAQALFDTIHCDRYSFLAREREAMAHSERYSIDIAIAKNKEALLIAERIGNPNYISSTLIRLAECYDALKMPDSAIVCLSDNRVIPSHWSYINLSYAYSQKREWSTALAYNDTSITYSMEEYGDVSAELLDRADILVNMGDYYSCNKLLDTIAPQSHIGKLAYARTKLIANIQDPNSQLRLKYFHQYDEALDSITIINNKLEVENIDRMISDRKEIAASRDAIVQRFFNFTFGVVLIFIILSLITVRLKWQKDQIDHKNAELESHKAQIMRQLLEETIKKQTIEQQLASIEEAQNDYSTRRVEEKTMKKSICQNISEGLLRINGKQTIENKCQFIIEQIDYIYPQLSQLLQSRYKELTVYDVLICSMTRVGFSASYIAEVLCKSVYTINKRRGVIRDIIAQQEHNDSIQWNEIWALLDKRKRNTDK